MIASVTAGSQTFKDYKSGIIDSCEPNLKANHAVLIVGYGTEVIHGEPTEYFIIKNSFGQHWGEQGYAKISAAPSNVCGILSDVFLPTFAKPNQKEKAAVKPKEMMY